MYMSDDSSFGLGLRKKTTVSCTVLYEGTLFLLKHDTQIGFV